jgi:HSP20 family protein
VTTVVKEVTIMRAITLWRPRNDLLSWSGAVDRFFDDGLLLPHRLSVWTPFDEGFAMDMYREDGNLVVKAEVPGISPEELDISVKDNVLRISGESKAEEEVERENYICRERRYGSLRRSVLLPSDVDGGKAEATFENGLLTVTIPVSEEVKPESIKVKVKES